MLLPLIVSDMSAVPVNVVASTAGILVYQICKFKLSVFLMKLSFGGLSYFNYTSYWNSLSGCNNSYIPNDLSEIWMKVRSTKLSLSRSMLSNVFTCRFWNIFANVDEWYELRILCLIYYSKRRASNCEIVDTVELTIQQLIQRNVVVPW